MKYAIVTDTHIGVRADANSFAEYQDRFWRNEFFPKCKAAGIKTILHGGDFFDKRQYVTVKTMERVKKVFCALLEEYDMDMYLIVGNHDVLYRNTNEANSPSNVFFGYDNVHVIVEPTQVGNVLLVPWLNRENYDAFTGVMTSSKAPYCLGHFEITGFEMHRGQVCDGGMGTSLFDGFKLAMSGHFHTRSSKGNITYLGSPFELTWADYNDPKGFHFFDDQTGELEFIENPESMFFRVEYDRENDARTWVPYKPKDISNKFIKVIVLNKGSAYEFDKWTKEILSYGPADLQIIESSVDITGVQVSIDELEAKAMTNLDIISQYVAGLELDLDKKKSVLNYMQSIFTEAEGI